jgi:hypothetical protein
MKFEPIRGTAKDTNFLKYELTYAPAGETGFTLLTTGIAPVSNGKLGSFDPTLLINDQYTIRLTVFDRGGNVTSDERSVTVEGASVRTEQTCAQRTLKLPAGVYNVTFGASLRERGRSSQFDGEFVVSSPGRVHRRDCGLTSVFLNHRGENCRDHSAITGHGKGQNDSFRLSPGQEKENRGTASFPCDEETTKLRVWQLQSSWQLPRTRGY